MRIDLKHLRAFVAVAKNLHFSQAADEIHVSQPTLTLLIQQLERVVGAPLVYRSTRHVELTEMGRALLPTAQNLSDDLATAIDSIRDLVELKRGKVTIAALPSVAFNLLPDVIVRFNRLYPDIKLRVIDQITDSLVESILSGVADFAIGYLPDGERGINVEPLYEDEIIVLVPAAHKHAQKSELKWREIVREVVVSLPGQTSVGQLIDRVLTPRGIRLNPALEPHMMLTISSLVSVGFGLGILPSSFVTSSPPEGTRVVRAVAPLIRRPIGILTRKGRTLSPSAAAMHGIILEHLRDQK